MPVTSTKTTTIPGLAAPATPDLIAFDLHVSKMFKPTGVTGTGNINIQAYRANEDGTNPIAIGPSVLVLNSQDVFVQASADVAAGKPELAALILAANAYVQALVTAKGL